MRKLRLLLRASLVLLVAAHLLWPARKQKQEEEIKTQVRELLPEPPPVVTAEASRLVFGMAPPARQGLLSRQVRDSLRALFKLQRRSRIVHLRAFVAGSGDTRRVRAVVSEVFADKKQPLPSLTVVQVGKLPIQGTQVILQWVAESRKVTNPEGLAFLSRRSRWRSRPWSGNRSPGSARCFRRRDSRHRMCCERPVTAARCRIRPRYAGR